jgi:hypothetical protein
MFHGHLDYFQKPPLGGRPNTKPGDHETPNTHNRWFILFYHACGHAWIKIHWNSIWLRTRSHMTSHYTWGTMTTLHDFVGVLGRPLDAFFWALTISRSRLLTRVWSGPKSYSNGFLRLKSWDLLTWMGVGTPCNSPKVPWPLHFKHSHWWKRRSRSKFASHYAWGTNKVCECKMDVKSTWILTLHRMDRVSWSLGLFSKTTSWR